MPTTAAAGMIPTAVGIFRGVPLLCEQWPADMIFHVRRAVAHGVSLIPTCV